MPHLCAVLPISFSSLTYSELPEAKNKITTGFGSDLNYFFCRLKMGKLYSVHSRVYFFHTVNQILKKCIHQCGHSRREKGL